MISMAVGATGRPGRAQSVAHAVDARRVLTAFLLMAGSATHPLDRGLVIRMLVSDVHVATGAGVGRVHRAFEDALIDKNRHFLPVGPGLGQGLVGVAVEAGGV